MATELILLVITTLVTITIGLIIFVSRKFEQMIMDNKLEIERVNKEITLLHSRLDIHDIIASYILKDSVSSEGIALDKLPWPRPIFGEKPTKPKKKPD